MENIENSGNKIINFEPFYNLNKLSIKSSRKKLSPIVSLSLKTTDNNNLPSSRMKGKIIYKNLLFYK